MTMQENPFPALAVSTFAMRPVATAELTYMSEAAEYLEQYLVHYYQAGISSAGAVGLVGSYGEGKTHLLNWIGMRATDWEPVKGVSRPNVAYGKADSASFFDIYKQLMRHLTRERIVNLIETAVGVIARRQAAAAAATQAVVARIEQDGIEPLMAEGNVDQIAVINELRATMTASRDIPPDIPMMVIAVGDPIRGQSAYRWLLGERVADLASFGIDHDLQSSAGNIDAASTDAAALDALESIARLHRIAQVPFIVLVDQLESLVINSAQNIDTLFSLFKKFVEQLARQETLVYIAGTEAGWSPFKRDSIDRLYTRPAIAVGHLTPNEIILLLDAFLNPSGASSTRRAFSPDVGASIHELSDGNVRETLRIAYETYNAAEGHIESATRDDVRRAAQESGTLEDRRALALTIVDVVLARRGSIMRDVGVLGSTAGRRWVIDRMLEVRGRSTLALMTVVAVDKNDEADLSLMISDVAAYLRDEYPGVPLIVTAVGYSSAEVAVLVGSFADTIVFRADDYAGRLEARVQRLLAPSAAAATSTEDAVLSSARVRLGELQEKRLAETDAVSERFKENVEIANEPLREERKRQTTWELSRSLDKLRDAVIAGNSGVERDIMRDLLTANAIRLNDSRVEALGSLYLELLSMYSSAASVPMVAEKLHKARLDLASDLRNVLRKGRAPWLAVTDPRVLYSWVAFWGVAIVLITAATIISDPKIIHRNWVSIFVDLQPTLFVTFFAAAVSTYLWLIARMLDPAARWAARVRRLTAELDDGLIHIASPVSRYIKKS